MAGRLTGLPSKVESSADFHCRGSKQAAWTLEQDTFKIVAGGARQYKAEHEREINYPGRERSSCASEQRLPGTTGLDQVSLERENR